MDVADASIGELVERLVQVAEENTWLALGVKDEIHNLVDDLKLLKANLKKASAHESANHVLKDVVDKILNVVSDAEDAICKYSMEKRKHTVKGIFSFGFAKEIQSIRGKVKKIQQDHAQAFQAFIYEHDRVYIRCTVELTTSVEELVLQVDRLEVVLQENASLLIVIKGAINKLWPYVEDFRSDLKVASKNQIRYDNFYVLRDELEKIRNVVSDVEDMIDIVVVKRKKYKDKGVLLRCLETLHYYATVYIYARRIHALTSRVRKIENVCHLDPEGLMPSSRKRDPALRKPALIPEVEEENVVGLDNEVEIIKNDLLGGSKNLRFISINGMVGLGKTTLTKMVFWDRDIEYEFFYRYWVCVSRPFNKKQIFLNILSNFTKKTKDFDDMSEENLVQKIREFLRDRKYLIVIDDLRDIHDWISLKIAFPRNKNGSRVLVTTQYICVARVSSSNNPHQLKFLEDEESWELLKRKVFGKEGCPLHLERLGRRIATKCNGLPLAVISIAGVLHKDSSASEWKRLAHDPLPVINRENQSYNALVKLRYDELPSLLKVCFLYLATFPKGHEIAAWKLTSLWIAEGLIPRPEYTFVTEEVEAEEYLEQLVNENFVMVLKRRADGRIKTCHIHNTLHEFCRTEATKKNLFQEMHGGEYEVNNITRRICVRSNVLELLRSENKQSNEHVRSFLSCSIKQDIPNDCLAAIPKSFPLLRVMDVEYLKFSMLPKEFFRLYHLRFLAMSTEFNILPKLFNNLSNMETLVLNTTESSLEVKAGIWSMRKLRHVYCNTSMQLPPPPKHSMNSSGSIDLKTLCTISPSSCTGEIFDKTPDLQKLGIRGNLVELLKTKREICLFDNLQNLRRLENLKLINNDVDQGSSMLQIGFPRAKKFPPRLRKLTLSNTAFEWNSLSILGMLGYLEVLKLEDNAFKGESCDVNNVVFKSLQYLRIGSSDLVSWTVSKATFPILKCLILRHCTMLDVVPSAFGEVESLKVMELYCTNEKAVISAREIHKEKGGGFQLSINSPL
ncbi:PREDICTED: putative late blight resistance protein homolog R1B-14 [Ipomoea nil]|uniref:putative late blight resistance protein homolog R1B-14 n=1 Tax=Ipomoea nil TaxID=35883 RepID=UPI000901C333|nr:PREDICTED: putative late blight resistance protein homolog R1B-14 [Ipomoea nil]